MDLTLNGSLSDFGNILAAVSALGTAAFGLVDATKAYKGGVSNIGFGFIQNAVTPYNAALELVDKTDPLTTIRANWLNGLPKADQKATVKSLIRLGITAATVSSLAAAAPGVDNEALKTAAMKLDSGEQLNDADLNVLGRFDAILDAQMDAGFERADQQYRNSAKVLAAGFAILLALAGMWIVRHRDMGSNDFFLALLLGVVSTPLAPIAKDLASALGTAVSSVKSLKA